MQVSMNLKRDEYPTIWIHDVPKNTAVDVVELAPKERNVKIGNVTIVLFEEEEWT